MILKMIFLINQWSRCDTDIEHLTFDNILDNLHHHKNTTVWIGLKHVITHTITRTGVN